MGLGPMGLSMRAVAHTHHHGQSAHDSNNSAHGNIAGFSMHAQQACTHHGQ